MIGQVDLYIRNRKLLSKGRPVLVALSGGADSVALLCVLHELGYSLHALHCNFHLRGEESDRDESFVTRLCRKLNVPLSVKHFDTREFALLHHMSIEMAARELRYGWFRSQIQETGAQGIAVAHHRDDQAETLLLNLLRGTGLRGMAGMWSQREGVIRPLLCVGRQDILHYLSSINQDFVTDSTNLERDAVRNRIRLDVLPLLQSINPQAATAISQFASIMQGSLPYYHKGIRQTMNEHDITTLQFGRQWLTGTPEADILLNEWLRPMHFNATQQAEMMASGQSTSGRIWESDTHRVLLDRTCLVAEAKCEAALMPVIEQDIVDAMQPADASTAYFDADLLKMPLHIRRAETGDRMVPFGMKGWKLVSDMMTDKKFNRFQKERQCVVQSGDDIIWLVGVRSDNRFRVTEHTTRILRLRVSASQ